MSTDGVSVEDVDERLADETERLNLELAKIRRRITKLEEQLQEERERREEIERTAKTAFAVADDRAESEEDLTKTRRVEKVTRNELVRRVAAGVPSTQRPMTVGEIHDQLTPEFDKEEFAHALVTNAWENLVEQWGCFRETEKRGDKALTVDPAEVSKKLTTIVEFDLGREDITNRVFRTERGGED